MKRVLALLGVATIACSSAPRHLTLGLPRAAVAEIRGLDKDSGSFGLPPPECHVHFQAIDGVDLQDRFEGGLPQTIDLRPGEHGLRCWYSVKPVGEPRRRGTCDVQVSVQADRVYQVVIDWGFNSFLTGAGEFTVELRDITEELRQIEQEKAARKQAEAARKREAGSKLEPY